MVLETLQIFYARLMGYLFFLSFLAWLCFLFRDIPGYLLTSVVRSTVPVTSSPTLARLRYCSAKPFLFLTPQLIEGLNVPSLPLTSSNFTYLVLLGRVTYARRSTRWIKSLGSYIVTHSFRSFSIGKVFLRADFVLSSLSPDGVPAHHFYIFALHLKGIDSSSPSLGSWLNPFQFVPYLTKGYGFRPCIMLFSSLLSLLSHSPCLLV